MTKTKRAKVSTVQNVIHDSDILLVKTLRTQVEMAEEALKALKTECAQAEASLTVMLRNKSKFSGDLRAHIDTQKDFAKFSPKYKEEYVSHMMGEHGETEAQIELRLRQKYPQQERTTETLVID